MIRIWGIFLFLCFSLTGCSFQPFKGIAQIKKNVGAETVQRRLQEGNRLFQEGNYKGAEKIFQNLRSVEDPLITRQAIFGLACTRLRLADNREQFLDAAKLLDQWQRISPASLGPEDPRMLLPFVPKTMLPKSGSRKRGGDALSSVEEPLLMRFYDYEREIDKLLQRIATLKKQIKAAEDREDFLKVMETELEMLRNQIRSIETIDQEILEKKQGISSP